MDKNQYTPMMQHYLTLKEENPDVIIMYRLGDFYEMFFEDALTCSKELDLTLTKRAAGKNHKAPMCGIPYHAASSYISRLVKKGYKVAICEQLTDPAASKGLVERGIIKIYTPGTYMEDFADQNDSNYLCVITSNAYSACLLFCELSTGQLRFHLMDRSLNGMMKIILDMQASEVIASRNIEKKWIPSFQERSEWMFSLQKPMAVSDEDLALLPYKEPLLQEALEVLMGYISRTQMQHMDHFSVMEPLYPPAEMIMDYETKNHLELTRTSSSYIKAKSLWEFMDYTKTHMGSRLLKRWVESPLLNIERIENRLDGVQHLLDQFLLREQLRDHLEFVYDLERLIGRISCMTASPRDLIQLISSLEHSAPILELAADLEGDLDFSAVDPCMDLYDKIKNAIVSEPPATLKDGNVIAPGFHQELDEIRRLADHGQDALLEMESRLKEETGIRSLKIGYNRVFGYYIEIRNGSLSEIKDEYNFTAKQTLANATRFINPELKKLEAQILSATERKVRLEQEIFTGLLLTIKAEMKRLHALSRALSEIDVLCSLAALANEYGYVRPQFNEDHVIDVQEGRHPILDAKDPSFVSNDWHMDGSDHIELITGPNMGGKSTYLRQNALIAIMAQMGSFVPARKAVMPVFDRIFTRIGANDDILTGKSTFMVEMMEANIALRNATENSLILFDEIGRGTATYDGMSLAQAMMEYIDEAIQAKTLFSTHYHELTEMEEQRPGIFNVHVDVREKKDVIQFLYRVNRGKADKSYGINVARLAHLPSAVLERASDLLSSYEIQNQSGSYQPSLFVMEKTSPAQNQIMDLLREIDADDLSARDSLQLIYRLKKMADESEK